MPRPLCRHCVERVVTRARGLCDRCFSDLDVRALYPRNPCCGDWNPNETLEDLERQIAERRATMPPDKGEVHEPMRVSVTELRMIRKHQRR